MRSVIPTRSTPMPSGWQTAVLLGVAGLAASTVYVQAKKNASEKANPPQGKFVDVDGVRLHYIERGHGQALVLLHGNGLFADDFELSGLLGEAGNPYRVIAFDRPGFGYSDRPGDTTWTPEEQARLIYKALHLLGVERPIVVGHSWGTLVTLALALDYPKYIRGITLVSGYYYPSPRVDAMLMATPALPGIGHLLRYTVSPLVGRLMWPGLVKKMFGPAPVPERFRELPVWMTLRPKQLQASAAESGLMVAAAARLSQRYGELVMPVAVIAGGDDQIVDPGNNALRFHNEVRHSELIIEPGVGHMAHYANPALIMDAVSRLESGPAHAGNKLRTEGTGPRPTRLH